MAVNFAVVLCLLLSSVLVTPSTAAEPLDLTTMHTSAIQPSTKLELFSEISTNEVSIPLKIISAPRHHFRDGHRDMSPNKMIDGIPGTGFQQCDNGLHFPCVFVLGTSDGQEYALGTVETEASGYGYNVKVIEVEAMVAGEWQKLDSWARRGSSNSQIISQIHKIATPIMTSSWRVSLKSNFGGECVVLEELKFSGAPGERDTGIPCDVVLGADYCKVRGRAECEDGTCKCTGGYTVPDGGHLCSQAPSLLADVKAGFPWMVMMSSMFASAFLTAVVLRLRRGDFLSQPLLE